MVATSLLTRTQMEMSRLLAHPEEIKTLEGLVTRIVEERRDSNVVESEGKKGTTMRGSSSIPISIPVSIPGVATSVGKPESTGRTKVCTKCKLPKSVDRFPPHPDTADGLAAWCKDCRAVLRKRRNQNNMQARLKHHFAARMTQQLLDSGTSKEDIPPLVANMESYLGYKMVDLVRYLGDDIQEREGMSLKEAFDSGYHVDHITPLSKFLPHEIGDSTFRRCWSMDNLRAIPAVDNLKKGSKDIFEEST